jgi:cytochrome c551/c552
MPVPEERLYRPERLNVWFAITSVLMTLAFFWLIWIDYDRPWREHQKSYFVGKAGLAHLDYLQATTQERENELKEARQRLRDAREYAERTVARQRTDLSAKLDEARFEFARAEAPYSRLDQVLAVTKDTYEKALGRYGPDHPESVEAKRVFAEQEDRVEKLRQEKEHWQDQRRELEELLKELDAPVLAADKRVREIEQTIKDARSKDQQYRGVLSDQGLLGGIPIVAWAINMPLLDFTAPKNTPAREEVKQYVLPDVRQNLNYLVTYTTDRCTTCHIAIDDPEFAIGTLARKLERSLPAINEALQREGLDPLPIPAAPRIGSAGVAPEDGTVTEHWDEITPEQQKAYFQVLLGQVNTYLKQTDRRPLELGQPLLAHPELDLYVSVDSPHPVAKLGCTVCHEGNPQETDFVLAAHSAETHAVRERWAERYYQRRMGIVNTTFETIEHYWDRPMHLPKYTEASCSRCHSAISDISDYHGRKTGSRINRGRYLFTTVGCVNCHNVDDLPDARRVGPDLTHVAAKLEPGFVEQWVWYPQGFKPSTRMPHFFMQENNREENDRPFDPDPDPVLRTETEVMAIRRYLYAVSKPWDPIPLPEGVEGDVERGRALFRKVGCLACHANMAEFGEEWITRDLMQRDGLDAERARHRYLGMTQDERVRYAMGTFIPHEETFFDPDAHRFDPSRPHNLPKFSRFAPELSGMGSKTTPRWLFSWLTDPPHYAPLTRMPSLRLNETEAADITAYLMTLQKDGWISDPFPETPERLAMADRLILDNLTAQRTLRHSRSILEGESGELAAMIALQLKGSFGVEGARELVGSMDLAQQKWVFLGAKMVSHYGCYACHTIPGFEESAPPGTDLSRWGEKPVTQLDFAFYDHAFHDMREEHEEVFERLYPPDAHQLITLSPTDNPKEEITHTHGAFAKHKLLNPRIWDRRKIKKPYDKLKMPNFYFTEDEADALTTYLLSRVSPRVTDELKVDYEREHAGPIARGRNLTRDLNCVGCHEVEDNEPTIQQYYRREMGGQLSFDAANAPPSLLGEGAKIQHNWFHQFLSQVEPLRPWLQVRMPSFHLTGEEATTLVEYLAALSRHDSERIRGLLGPVDEYLAGVHDGAGATSPAWYRRDSLEDEAVGLRRFAIARRLLRPADLDLLKVRDEERLIAAHEEMLDRVRFIGDLYDVEYPFVEPPRPLSRAERFEVGGRLFNDMACLKCHVMGEMLPGPPATTGDFVQTYRLDGVRGEDEDAVALLNGEAYSVGSTVVGPFKLVSASNVYNETGDVLTTAYVEGPNASGEVEQVILRAASAPNLSLAHRRLRRAWVYAWMLQPQWIQPGTKMPQNFADGRSPFEGVEEYPGTGLEHVNLLVDYLYDAGFKGVRWPLTKIVVRAEEEGEFEEDEFFEEPED